MELDERNKKIWEFESQFALIQTLDITPFDLISHQLFLILWLVSASAESNGKIITVLKSTEI